MSAIHFHGYNGAYFMFSVLLLVVMVVLNSPCSGISLEGRVLLQLKESDWINKSNGLQTWNASHQDPCTNWEGVFCNNLTKAVTKINFTGFFIGGNLSSAISIICKLQHLRALVLTWNHLVGQFPEGLVECKRLQTLDLSQNRLVGSLPDVIYQLPEIIYLDLSSNNFSGSIPPGFGMVKKVEVLDLSYNLLNGRLPAFLGNLSSLVSLTMDNNPFDEGTIPEEFGKLQKLQTLFLTECSLVGRIPSTLGNLSEIRVLDLGINSLSGSIPPSLMTLRKMTLLVLSVNLLSGEIPSNFGELRSLKTADLSMNHLSGSIPEGVGNLTYLEGLDLYENTLSGTIPSQLEKLPNLHDVRIFTNNLTGVLPQNLGMNSKLYEFDVSSNNLYGPVPPHLCRGGILANLELFSNNFSGSLPSSLNECRTLISVSVSGNKLSGEVPVGVWSGPVLEQLELDHNSFHGRIPPEISNTKLYSLYISHNHFTGRIPPEIGKLSRFLTIFSASCNNLWGRIPEELTELGELNKLLLDHNSLSGQIPQKIISWRYLWELNLANNELEGVIPGALGSLPAINALDLSNNHLRGRLPPQLAYPKFTTLNLSGNHLCGPIPKALNNLAYNLSFLDNPELCGGGSLGLHSCTGHFSKLSKGILALASTFVTFAVVLICWLLFHLRHEKKKCSAPSWEQTNFSRLAFRESDIIKNLREENVIGVGAAGRVYKVSVGKKQVVAVKKICKSNHRLQQALQDKEFQAEVDILANIRHNNIVKLLCCISSQDSQLLVYEYMPNGNLFDCLRRSEGAMMQWPIRHRIAVGSALALCYMHHDCSPPILHRDVKSANILLDSEFQAKIADFGLARILHKLGQQDSMSVVAGSYGYIAPEYAYTMKVNEKSDIYSFGVVLLELVSGKDPMQIENSNIVGWIRNEISNRSEEGMQWLLDCQIQDLEVYTEYMIKMLRLGMICTSNVPAHRPSMKEIVEMLGMCCPNKQERESFTLPPTCLNKIPTALGSMCRTTSFYSLDHPTMTP